MVLIVNPRSDNAFVIKLWVKSKLKLRLTVKKVYIVKFAHIERVNVL